MQIVASGKKLRRVKVGEKCIKRERYICIQKKNSIILFIYTFLCKIKFFKFKNLKLKDKKYILFNLLSDIHLKKTFLDF